MQLRELLATATYSALSAREKLAAVNTEITVEGAVTSPALECLGRAATAEDVAAAIMLLHGLLATATYSGKSEAEILDAINTTTTANDIATSPALLCLGRTAEAVDVADALRSQI